MDDDLESYVADLDACIEQFSRLAGDDPEAKIFATVKTALASNLESVLRICDADHGAARSD